MCTNTEKEFTTRKQESHILSDVERVASKEAAFSFTSQLSSQIVITSYSIHYTKLYDLFPSVGDGKIKSSPLVLLTLKPYSSSQQIHQSLCYGQP